MNQYANPQAVVDTGWLAEHQDDPDLVLLDIHLDPTPYEAGHIPGAVFWHAVGTILQPNYQTNFDSLHVQRLLGSAGISEDSTIVVTSDHMGMPPWAYWYLKGVGQEDVRVLNGGNQKWKAENRPTTTEVPTVVDVGAATAPIDLSRRADLDEVMSIAADGDGVLLDVRAEEEFRGELFMIAPPTDAERSGHIPGASYVYFEDALNEDGTFRSVDQLTDLYGEAGVTADSRVITYCAVGMRAGHSWFVLTELLGFPNVANYDLSWNEWGRRPDTPIESGGPTPPS